MERTSPALSFSRCSSGSSTPYGHNPGPREPTSRARGPTGPSLYNVARKGTNSLISATKSVAAMKQQRPVERELA